MNKLHVLLLAAAVCFSCGGRNVLVAESGESSEPRPFYGEVLVFSDSLIHEKGADTLYFGRLRSGETAVKELMLRNGADRAFVITSIDLTCGCIEADYPKKPLREGEEALMTLLFDSRGLGGWIYKTVLVYTSLDPRPYTLVVTADVD